MFCFKILGIGKIIFILMKTIPVIMTWLIISDLNCLPPALVEPYIDIIKGK